MKNQKPSRTEAIRTLQQLAYAANLALVEHRLVLFTWGNASAYDPRLGLLAIKPSGVPYADLRPADMVVLRVASGEVAQATSLRPSSDAPTHRRLYQALPGISGLVHVHSPKATAWAQAGQDLPCLGTTHADYFYGTIPCTAEMTPAEILRGQSYEWNTAEVILREFRRRKLKPLAMPAVLVRGHAPFVWGETPAAAVHNAVVLESIAGMALDTRLLSPKLTGISQGLLNKHYRRKHGIGAYYGQTPQ